MSRIWFNKTIVTSGTRSQNFAPPLAEVHRAQNLFATLHADADRHIHGPVLHPPVDPHLYHQSVQVDDRINRIQKSTLPRLDSLTSSITLRSRSRSASTTPPPGTSPPDGLESHTSSCPARTTTESCRRNRASVSRPWPLTAARSAPRGRAEHRPKSP
jgi:hypothetical protein